MRVLALLGGLWCLTMAGCCLCAHPCDECGPMCRGCEGDECYAFARKNSAFSPVSVWSEPDDDARPAAPRGEPLPAPGAQPPVGAAGSAPSEVEDVRATQRPARPKLPPVADPSADAP